MKDQITKSDTVAVEKTPADSETKRNLGRRRALLGAVIGSGSLAASQKWVTPVIGTVLLPAHAGMSAFPVGNFGSGLVAEGFQSPENGLKVENIAQRSEKEILDFFIQSAQAADTCPMTSGCGSTGEVSVAVVSTITANPSPDECIQARVDIDSGASCSPECLLFTFTADVNGNQVTVADNCQLQLTNMTLTNNLLSGDWAFSSGALAKNGSFESDENESGGCGTLPSCTL